MRARVAALALASLLLGLSGCIAADPAARCPEPAELATPVVDGWYMQTDPAQAWQTVVLAPADAADRTVTLAWNASKGTAYGATLSPAGAPARFEVGTVLPAGAGNATLDYVVDGPGACRQSGGLEWDLAAPKAGRAASAGQGVHVMTAGFFENGTLFYTNIAEIDTDPAWPKVSWYAWEGDMPLPVYVYDADRAEQPAYWKGTYSAASQVPPTGTPLDPEVHEVQKKSGEADMEYGIGYFTTIPGFNAALKGLSTTTTRVVRLAPEEAYTRPGNEEHPLYGHPIVFYIKVLDVVDTPCPAKAPGLACQVGLPARLL